MSDGDDIGDTAFGVQVGIGFVGKVTTAVIGFVGSVVLARALGPGNYGLFYVTLSIAQFLENPISGWAEACRKRMTESGFDPGEAVGSVFLIIGLTAVVLGPLSASVLSIVASNPVTPVAVPLLFIPMATYWSLSKLLTGRSNFSMSVWGGVLSTAAKMSLMSGFVLAGFEVWGMVYGTALGTLLTAPIVFYWIGVRPTFPSKMSLVSIWEFARWSIPRGFVGTALQRMDIILLGWLVSAGFAGKYQVALQISMPAVFISGVIGSGLVGRISNLASRNNEWHSDIRNSLAYSSILAIPIFFASLVVGEELVTTVFGSEYAGGGIFLIGLAAYRLIRTQTSPWESAISGLDYPQLSFWISLCAFVLNIILGISFWYVYGAIGILAATVVTAGLGYTARVLFVHKLSTVDFVNSRPFLEQLGAAIAMVLILVPTKFWLGGAGERLTLSLILGIGGATYAVILLVISGRIRKTAMAILNDFIEEYIKSN